MNSKNRKIRLGDICEITSSKRIFAREYCSFGVPFYRGKEIIEKQAGKTVSTKLYIDESRYEEIAERFGVPQKDDILLTSVGTLGIPYVVGDEQFYFKDGNLTWIRNFQGAYSKYLYYWLLSPFGKEQIDRKSIGSTQKALTIETLLKFEIELPELSVQRTIADTLSAIDAKIANNTKINQHLEQIAQAIYANKFPVGYGSTSPISELIDIRDGTHDSPKAIEHGFPLVTSKHLLPYGVNLANTNRISKTDFDKINERSKVERNDILISMIGTIGLISLVTEHNINFAIKNVGLFRTSQAEKWVYFLLCFLRSPEITNHIDMRLAGSTQRYISLSELRKLPVTIPTFESLHDFNDFVRPLFEEITLRTEESVHLATIRDTLLPRLMAGEINIDKIS